MTSASPLPKGSAVTPPAAPEPVGTDRHWGRARNPRRSLLRRAGSATATERQARDMRRSSIRLATVACALFAAGIAGAAPAATGGETKAPAAGQYRKWIAEMKDDARGPFS